MTVEFVKFPSIPRYSRDVIVTEKIDGTNAQIYINDNCEPFTLNSGRVVPFMVGSRKRWIFPEDDNFGFARWAYDNAEELLKLGAGHHFGEWWGSGIQRKYGLKDNERHFSIFNVSRWASPDRPVCCDVVPIIWQGTFDSMNVNAIMRELKITGSIAKPGFLNPEGIVIYHTASNSFFKKTFEKDDTGKGVV